MRNQIDNAAKRIGAMHCRTCAVDDFYALQILWSEWYIKRVVTCLRVVYTHTVYQYQDLTVGGPRHG